MAYKGQPSPWCKGERVVAGILRRYACRYHGKVINDLYLPLYDQTTQIDHILIAPFGMIVVETKNYKGKFMAVR